MEKEDFSISWAKSLPKAADHVPRPGGFLKTADGAIKGRNVAKVAAGTGAVGLGSWFMFDNNAGEKAGGALGNVGSGIGGAFSGLLGGLGEGLFGQWLLPGCGLCCCVCVLICIAVAYMKMS